MTTPFTITRRLRGAHDEVLARVRDAIAAEGMGVLTEIDLQATLAAKLGVQHGRYRILGACHPPSAHAAVQAVSDIGVMLPCNVVVYEAGAGEIVVSAIDPERTVAALGDSRLAEIAKDIRGRLERIVARVAAPAASG